MTSRELIISAFTLLKFLIQLTEVITTTKSQDKDKEAKEVFSYKVMIFKVAQKVVKYFGHFCTSTICCEEKFQKLYVRKHPLRKWPTTVSLKPDFA